MNVKFVDLKEQYDSIKDQVLAEINDVLENTAYISGKKVKKFEEDFSALQDIKYCCAVSSGTDALIQAFKMMDIQSGSEVIVPVNTFIATSASVTLSGAKPVFVDHDEKTYTIDVTKIEAAINENTKAIVPVHLYGQPAEMDAIMEIAKRHGLLVIEDCAQSHLAEYKGIKTGKFGKAGTFSFYPGKNLGAYGEGGAIVTKDEELYHKLIKFRQHGSEKKYYHEFEGSNFRMEEIQAGVLNVKLNYIKDWTEKRRKNAEVYYRELATIKNEEVITPYVPDYSKHVYHLYIIRAQKREELIKYLADKGVQTALHYPLPLHMQQAYSYLGYKQGDFPVAEKCCSEILSLPMYPELKEEEIVYVCDSIKSFYGIK